MGKLIDADKLLADLKDKKKSLRESLNFAKWEGEAEWADELRGQMQILTLIIDGVEHGGYDPDPTPSPTIKPGDKVYHSRFNLKGTVKRLSQSGKRAYVIWNYGYMPSYVELKSLEVVESD